MDWRKAEHICCFPARHFLASQLVFQVEAETEIQLLKERCMMLESGSNPSVQHVDLPMIDSSSELHLDLDELIFLVGGYDGEQWLSALDAYSPTLDRIKSRRPMNSARSYASIAKLNGELYVFGGGNGSLWYNTGTCSNSSLFLLFLIYKNIFVTNSCYLISVKLNHITQLTTNGPCVLL